MGLVQTLQRARLFASGYAHGHTTEELCPLSGAGRLLPEPRADYVADNARWAAIRMEDLGRMRVLIADDHRLIVEGVKSKLAELDTDMEFRVAMNVAELRDELEHQPMPDVAIVDLSMPGATGPDHIAAMLSLFPGLPVVVLSGAEDPVQMKALLDLGVRGYIPKAYSPDIMLSAVRLVLSGGVYVPPMLLSAAGSSSNHAGEAQGDNHGVALGGLRQLLTERQIEVLRLLGEGKPNKLIARDLNISEGTVKIHLAAIFRALDVRNRVEAVVAARRLSTH